MENPLPLLKTSQHPYSKMDDTAWLEYLEEKVLEQAEASQATADTLVRILAKLNNLEIGRAPAPNPHTPAPVTVITPMPSSIKPGIPPNLTEITP